MTVFVHGVGFNKDWVASMTLTKFRGHPSNAHHWPDETSAEKRNRLTEAYKLCTDGDDSQNVPEVEDAEPSEGGNADNQEHEGRDSDPTEATIIRGQDFGE